MPRKDRYNYSPEQKVAILRRHLIDQIPVSQLCDEYKLQPTLFYRWQQQFFENGAAAFSNPARKDESKNEQRIAYLEQKLVRKDEVLAELMEEHIKVKKELGEI